MAVVKSNISKFGFVGETALFISRRRREARDVNVRNNRIDRIALVSKVCAQFLKWSSNHMHLRQRQRGIFIKGLVQTCQES